MSWLIQSSPLIDRASQPKSFYISEFSHNTLRTFQNVVTAALDAGQPFLPVNIESYGGEVYPLLGFLSIIDSARKTGLKFITYTSSIAASCGGLLFSYGEADGRFIGANAKLLFHNISGGFLGKIPESLADIQNLSKTEKEVFEKISKHLKKPKGYLTKMLEKKKNFDWELSAEEALAEGIATEIKVPNFVVSFEEKYGIV